MVSFTDLVFRAALLLLVLGIIWLAMGEELLADVIVAHQKGKNQFDTVGKTTPFNDYPLWLKMIVFALSLFAFVTVSLLLYLIGRNLRRGS
jgi:hypothetical protein